LQSHYSDILHCLPVDQHKTLNVLQHHFTVDQICQTLSSPDHAIANKTILQHLVDHFEATKNLKEFCNRLEKLTTLSPHPEQLVSIICKLRTGEVSSEEILCHIKQIITAKDDYSQPGATTLNNIDEVNGKIMYL